MAFLRRRTTDSLIPATEDPDNTYVARLAREEAKNDWKNKPRHEKVRLARVEMRRRKSEKEGIFHSQFWTKETLLIASLAFLGFIFLLFLLHHRSQLSNTTGHQETWLESVEDVLGLN